MTNIKHDIWKNNEGLTSLCFAGYFGEEARSILASDSKIIHSFYADSHFDAMTKYYAYMDWGVYENEFEIDKDFYNLEIITKRIKEWKENN